MDPAVLRSPRTVLAAVLVVAPACGRAAAEPAAAACEARFGAAPSLAAREAAARCNEDPAGAACDPTELVTPDAIRCRLAERYPRREFHGGLYFDVIAHRPVYRMFTALEPAGGGPVRPHRHVLLDARTGAELRFLRADPADSTVRRVLPDGTAQPLGRFAAFWIVADDRLVSFDAKVGKRFAEAYKLAARGREAGVPFTPGARFALDLHALVEGTPHDATADASVQGDPIGTNLRVIAPLPDGGRLELDLAAADTLDDQHGGY